MSKYICVNCGHVFDEDEMGTYSEHHPYGMGTAEEVFGCCPVCKGDFEEAVKCDGCGDYFPERKSSGWFLRGLLR